MKILISAGHNPGVDPGAIGQGVQEADRNVRICDRVVLYLRSWGIQTDYMPNNVGDLQAEINWANKYYSDDDNSYAIQIHTNAGGGTGNEVWTTAYKNQIPLATAIEKALCAANGLRDRGVKDIKVNNRPLGWINYVNAQSVLVESRFIDVDSMTQANDMVDAYGIATGIANFLGVKPGLSVEQEQINAANAAAQAQAAAKVEADRLAKIAEQARIEAEKALQAKLAAEAAAKKAVEEKALADKQKADADKALKDALSDNNNFISWLKNLFIIVSQFLVSWRK
jgi:N-acetylmuramoyl-L-alanine amidase